MMMALLQWFLRQTLMIYESPFRSVCKVHTYHSLTGFEPLDFRKSLERSPFEDGGGGCSLGCCEAGALQLLLNIPLLYIPAVAAGGMPPTGGPPAPEPGGPRPFPGGMELDPVATTGGATDPSIKEVVAVSCSPPNSP